ncbi:OPT oligopeptide transporter [Laetiporus sulphureus 93-53]|uniref:OPT oligopeptide transporter n=1 Tax=Laetiporus sulphureus 93-53 TaxID=1314785 RepID=A0A165H205_9APHY|nr:OPT oligopeptide transporter [Laetiporus sulphureus 93-53]KZT11134.1 OPT oligopeptide transporter [Laetiporus sulphureus 93-53]
MADPVAELPVYQEKHLSDESIDVKNLVEDAEIEVDDAKMTKEVEEMEDRLANDEASEDEYRVEEAYEVAVKVLSTKDDPELQAVTFRTIVLGLGFSAFGAVLAQIYYFKPQTLTVSTLLLLILSYWFGNGMHILLPSKGIWRFLNPGPFNIKEHVAIIIMSSTAATSAVAIQVISVQELYYNNNMNAGVAIFTLIGSQLIGYGYAGLLQDVLVKPTKCFWPSNIYTANLFQALHYDRQMTSKRVRLFWTVFALLFCWEIFPEWIFPVLTGVSVFCLADNHSSVVRNIFGGASNNEGMGLLAVCFDWNLISSTCLWSPLWLQLNQDIGIFFTYILMAGVYYGNIWKAKQFPFMSQAIFAENGSQYDQTALLTDGKFDATKYAELGPAYFSATNALYLITSNLSLGAIVTHVALYNWKDLKPFVLSLNPWSKTQFLVHDAHYEKMKVYKQIPRWWYTAVLLAAYGIAQATNYTGESGLPWWALTVLLIIGFVFCALYSTLAATIGFTEFNTSGNGFFQMITAYIVPGRPVANMYGAMYGAHPMQQGILFLQDLKLGQYCKLAPRVTFCMQMAGTVVGAILNYIMMLSIINAQRPALLSIAGTRLWSGQNAQSYNSNAISWGALGPEMFGPHSTYRMVPISLAIGLVLPIPFYIAYRIWPKAGFQNLNTSIIMQYSCYLSVGVNTSVNTGMALGILSQWWIRTRYPRWFTKYNYIVAAAMDGGTQVVIFILNFAIFGAAGNAHSFPEWWGNDLNLSADRCLAPA